MDHPFKVWKYCFQYLEEEDDGAEALNHVKDDSIKFNFDTFGFIFARKHKIEGRIRGIKLTLKTMHILSISKIFIRS